MKNILTISLATLNLVVGYSQEEENILLEAEKLALKENVKSIRISFYEMGRDGKVESPFVGDAYYAYDKNKQIFYQNSVETKLTMDKNKITKAAYYSKGQFIYAYHYFYKNELLSEEQIFNEDNFMIGGILYHYDSDKNLIGKTAYEGKKKEKISYKYSYHYKNKKKVEFNKYNSDNEIVGIKKYEYKNGNKIETIVFPKGLNFSIINIYNSKNELIERQEIDDSSLQKYIYKYKYDHLGNWITRTEYKVEKGTEIDDEKQIVKEVDIEEERRSVERKIEYY